MRKIFVLLPSLFLLDFSWADCVYLPPKKCVEIKLIGRIESGKEKMCIGKSILSYDKSEVKVFFQFCPMKAVRLFGDLIQRPDIVLESIGQCIYEFKPNNECDNLGKVEKIDFQSPIELLVTKLSSDHLWQNGVFPKIDLPASATNEELISKLLKVGKFEPGKIKIIQVKKVQINSVPGYYLATLVETNFGQRIILTRYQSPTGWWGHIFDIPPR